MYTLIRAGRGFLMAVAIGLVVLLSSPGAVHANEFVDPIDDTFYDTLARECTMDGDDAVSSCAIRWVNLYRLSLGLRPMVQHPALTKAAKAHAEYLSQNRLFDHAQNMALPGAVGADIVQRIIWAGYQTSTGDFGTEIIFGSDRSDLTVHTSMASVFHRRNLVDARRLDIGYGRAFARSVFDMGDYLPASADTIVVRFPAPNGAAPLLGFVAESPWPYATTRSPSTAISLHIPGQVFDYGRVQIELVDESTGEVLPTVLADNNVRTLNDLYFSATKPFVPGHWYRVRIQGTTKQGLAVDESWRFFASGQSLGKASISDDRSWAKAMDADGVPVVWRLYKWKWTDPAGNTQEGVTVSRVNGDCKIEPAPPPGSTLQLIDYYTGAIAQVAVPGEVAPARSTIQTVSTTGFTFKLGFAALAAQIPDIVGQPLEDEHWGANGDSLQRTTTGLMVWRKADNWTAFTNGWRTWVNGPEGVRERANDERFPWEQH